MRFCTVFCDMCICRCAFELEFPSALLPLVRLVTCTPAACSLPYNLYADVFGMRRNVAFDSCVKRWRCHWPASIAVCSLRAVSLTVSAQCADVGNCESQCEALVRSAKMLVEGWLLAATLACQVHGAVAIAS